MSTQDTYDQIIQNAKNENRIYDQTKTYYERHHIIPLSYGGTGKVRQWKTHPNIVLLTAREHFICHKLLCDIYHDQKSWFAFWRMCNDDTYNCSPEDYEIARINMSKKLSEQRKGKWKCPEDRKKKISATLKRMYASGELKSVMTPEIKSKISKARIGVNNLRNYTHEQLSLRAVECNKKSKQKRISSMKFVIKNYDNEKYQQWVSKRLSGTKEFYKQHPERRLIDASKNIGKHWWTNGSLNKFSFEPPDETYYLGMSGRRSKSGWKNKVKTFKNMVTGEIICQSRKPLKNPDNWTEICA